MSTLADAVLRGTLAARPAASIAGRLYYDTTNSILYRDSGSAWENVEFGGGSAVTANDLPWHISIIPMVWTPDATVGTWTGGGSTDSAFEFPLYVPGSAANSGGAARTTNATAAAINDAIAWDVVLTAGTWDAHFWVRRSTNTPIITLNEDGASKGTVDTYAAAAAAAKLSITGWTIATTGKKRMQLLLATKNASSTGYTLVIFAIEFRRTA